MTLLDENDIDEIEIGLPRGRQCQRIFSDGTQCENFLPSDAIKTQKYCSEHQPKKPKLSPPGDAKPPRSVTNKITVNLPKGNSKGEADALKVEGGAAQMLAFIPLALAMTGDEVCASAIQDAIPAIAHQLGELSKFQPVLKKIFTPGESTGEFLVWVGLILALSPVILAILDHHDVLPETVRTKIRSFVSVAGSSSELDDLGA